MRQLIGIVPGVDTDPPWWRYLTEVLDHVRLPYRSIPAEDLAADDQLDDPANPVGVLVFAGRPRVGPAARDAIGAWVESGVR